MSYKKIEAWSNGCTVYRRENSNLIGYSTYKTFRLRTIQMQHENSKKEKKIVAKELCYSH